MKYYLPFLAVVGLLFFGSCQNHDNDVPFSGPALDIRFVDSYSVAQGSPTRATQAADEFEKMITSLVLLAYPENAGDGVAPVIKYVFSDYECSIKRAIIPLGSATPGSRLDFYIVANSSAKYEKLKSVSMAEPTMKELADMAENESKITYNKGTFSKFASENVNHISGVAQGFAMSDKQTVAILDAGAGKPTEVNLTLNRTVARVDVKVDTTAAFIANYPAATLDIKSASVKFQPATGYILTRPETMTQSIANMAAAADSLNQDNYNSNTKAAGMFRYYIYSCANRNDTPMDFSDGNTKYDPTAHKHPLLTIKAVFYYNADPTNSKIIYYKIPLTGATKKGDFLRNNLYKVQVNISGVTDQEVKAIVEIADWQGVITQEVNIGG